MSRYFQTNLLLGNWYTRTVFLQHVISDSTTLDARRFRALGREFQIFEGITHEAAGQQEEQRVVDYQILLGPEHKFIGKDGSSMFKTWWVPHRADCTHRHQAQPCWPLSARQRECRCSRSRSAVSPWMRIHLARGLQRPYVKREDLPSRIPSL